MSAAQDGQFRGGFVSTTPYRQANGDRAEAKKIIKLFFWLLRLILFLNPLINPQESEYNDALLRPFILV
ncbi:hypothetical protein C2W62_54670 [Candidatus Entotheonella serta]|nr:hypothetical protein C2W62_54670 [Candidatus Entotheonella serta]